MRLSKPFLRLISALPLLAVPACGGADAASDGVLRFSAIPDSNTTELKEKFDLVAGYLSEELGVEVEYVASASYSASVEAFRNGDIQLAWFGGLSGCQARSKVDGARAIAQGTVDPDFKSYFIAHRDTGIEPGDAFPEGMRGRKFTFGSADSTSGRLMPEHFIRVNTGQSPPEFFGQPSAFSGSHDNTATQVQDGVFECGAMSYARYDQLVADGVIDPEVVRVVWTTPTYPDYNWTAHPVLESVHGEGFVDRLQRALVGMSDPDLLAAAQRPGGLIPATNADFEPIRQLAADLDFLRD